MHLPESYTKPKYTDFEMYNAYLALKNHFTKDSYDFHRYRGKSNAKFESFETRRDRYAFMKLTRHPDPIGLMIANLTAKADCWVGDLDQTLYTQWKARQDSLTYSFKEELSKIEDLDKALSVLEAGTKPEILRMLSSKLVSLETVCMIHNAISIVDYWDTAVELAIWENQRRSILKYAPFLEYDKAKVKEIVAKSLDIELN